MACGTKAQEGPAFRLGSSGTRTMRKPSQRGPRPTAAVEERVYREKRLSRQVTAGTAVNQRQINSLRTLPGRKGALVIRPVLAKAPAKGLGDNAKQQK